MMLRAGPAFPADGGERALAVADALAELAHMPSPRRDACLQQVAPALLDVTGACDDVSPAELLMRVATDAAFADELVSALRSLACAST